ncbi:MarR family transcriptional regulator [Salinirussus salinus]|jgi:DNA-binding IclR family transcriptional regulator|uniref:MarR family transcriptional regulator n=1 Tax=Salinirussus salinus TaxID=1198300 RepID=UPI00135C7E66|nr:MarR family transcriptional regulator [Salinirussus salinus]
MYTEPRVLAALEEGPATVPELAGRLDRHPATVQRRCARLQAQGLVRRTTGGAYVRVEGARGRAASD